MSMEDMTDEELQQLLETRKEQKAEVEKKQLEESMEALEESLTETGNAERFIDVMDGNAKYVQELRQWCYWGKEKWNLNEDGMMRRRFKEVVELLKQDLMCLEAKKIEHKNSGNEAAEKAVAGQIKLTKSWIRQSRNKNAIDNSIALATAEDGISVKYRMFDSKGHFFGVENGVVDLRTGELISGKPEYLMLKSSEITYDKDAECPQWEKFLGEIMEGDQDKIDLLQQIAGSALVGNVKERMFIFNGGGSNGKTKFVTMLSHILGTTEDDGYKVTVAPEVITGTAGSSGDYALAKIKGARLLVLNETGKTGGRSNVLDDTIVKRLVDSDDGFQARQIRGEPFEFISIATLLLLTNNLPKVLTTDNGIWRRLVLVTFNREFAEHEKNQDLVDGLLKPEAAGILKWCVEGAIKYFANGQKFDIPEVVANETSEWRGLEDKLGTFLGENIVENPETTIKLSELLDQYKVYCEYNGGYAGSERELKKALMARGMDVDNATSGGISRLKGWCWIDEQHLEERNVSNIIHGVKSSAAKMKRLKDDFG